ARHDIAPVRRIPTKRRNAFSYIGPHEASTRVMNSRRSARYSMVTNGRCLPVMRRSARKGIGRGDYWETGKSSHQNLCTRLTALSRLTLPLKSFGPARITAIRTVPDHHPGNRGGRRAGRPLHVWPLELLR